ncbi:conserved protein of unknown function [Petrocella atlantisensis]|uniref:ATPase n=1 Tax=Petrocella atlantisensis TaxID=2173034 RepID=A0A3P7PR07_9FIRM|nr:hypothetical protein [Petrocella atlantisensis]VDN46777.1 conserved protein of unknown function [Petrocella atlantisensis]
MEEVIKRIIDIEEKAQALMDHTLEEKETLIKSYEEKMQAMEKRIIEEAETKIEQIRKKELSDSVAERKAVESQCDLKMKTIEEKIRKHKEVWVTDLVNQVLNR